MKPAHSDKLRKLIAYGISIAPTSTLRVALLKAVFGYRFGANSSVGFGTIIAVDELVCGHGVIISRGNTLIGPISVQIGDRVLIGKYNVVECSFAIRGSEFAHMQYKRRLVIGEGSLINQGHLFDLAGEISIGARTWVAGFNSQFITHGASVMDRDIAIGNDCFIGSAVRFSPGSAVANNIMVGIGAVVTKRLSESNAVIAGIPAKVIRKRDEHDQFKFERVWER